MSEGPVSRWKPGDVVFNDYPFVRTTFDYYEEDGPVSVKSWRPGCDYEPVGPYGEDADAVADGVGKQILTVIDIHKPGRFPRRIFYTCKWVTPEGKEFGKGGLKITTVEAFNRRVRGFMSHDPTFKWRFRSQEEAA